MKHFLIIFNILLFLVSEDSMAQINSTKKYRLTDNSQVLLSGKIYLIKEITEKGDTIYETDLDKKFYVHTVMFDKNKKISKNKVAFGQSDSTYHYIDFNQEYKIFFKCKGYNTKGFHVNSFNIPNTTLGYEVGFEFPYRLYLIKNKKLFRRKKKIVAIIKYDSVNEYFDFTRPK